MTNLTNHTIQFTASVKNYAPCMIIIYKVDSEDKSSSSWTRIPEGKGTYTVTTQITEDIVRIWVRVDYVNNTVIGDAFYVDNFQLFIQ